jgi:transcription-repair coupling factor (superfamily II helicase)
LSEAVNEENGAESQEDIPCTVDLNVSAHIPESYIESLPARLGIYKRIAAIRNDDDASDVIDELCDRFGEPPISVMGLIDISVLRNKAAAAEIYEITGTANSAVLHIKSIKPEIASKLSAFFGNRFVLNALSQPVYTIRLNKGQKMSELVAELGKAL